MPKRDRQIPPIAVTDDERDRIEEAVKHSYSNSMSDFVRRAALKAADDAIDRADHVDSTTD